MIILAIESSGKVASAAVLKDGVILSEKFGGFKVTHSETLMPLIADVIDETGTAKKDIDIIAVSGGPGSFTGLRIGSASAKGLGLALDKPLVHVPTLDAMAWNFAGSDMTIVPIMDARRDQVYTGIYRFRKNDHSLSSFITDTSSCAMSVTELLKLLDEQHADENILFIGDGVDAFRSIIEPYSRRFTFASGENAYQRAASVAQLGALLAADGRCISADDEAPEYLRPSQAERVRAEILSETANNLFV